MDVLWGRMLPLRFKSRKSGHSRPTAHKSLPSKTLRTMHIKKDPAHLGGINLSSVEVGALSRRNGAPEEIRQPCDRGPLDSVNNEHPRIPCVRCPDSALQYLGAFSIRLLTLARESGMHST